MNSFPLSSLRSARPVVVHSPWAAFDTEIERLFAPVLTSAPAYRSAPRYAVEESDNQFTLRFEVPGVKRDALSLEWQDEELVLSIKRDEKAGQETVTREQRHTFSLPEAVQVDKASAALEDGVLTLHLPKVEPVKPHRIEIK